eukprot:410940_1
MNHLDQETQPKNIICAEQLKLEANKLFKQKKYKQSIDKYTSAIALHDKNAIYFANRSAAYACLHLSDDAVADAQKSIQLDPTYSKGYSRLAFAYQKQCKYKDAVIQYKLALDHFPTAISRKYILHQIKICKQYYYPPSNNDNIPPTTTKTRKLFPNIVEYNFSQAPVNELFETAVASEYQYGLFDRASEMYRYLCNLNHVEAICCYALWYVAGDRPGVSKDLRMAYMLYEYVLYLEPSNGRALYSMGTFYFNGNIVERDHSKALTLYQKAIDDSRMKNKWHHWRSYDILAQMYARGDGTSRNLKLADKYLKVAEKLRTGNYVPVDAKHQKETETRHDTFCALCRQYAKNKLQEIEEKMKEKPERYIFTVGEKVGLMKKCGYTIFGYDETMKNIECEDDLYVEFEKLGISYTVDLKFDWEKSKVKKVRICGGCREIIKSKVYLCKNCIQPYCNKKCQKHDWKSHKHRCKMIRRSSLIP